MTGRGDALQAKSTPKKKRKIDRNVRLRQVAHVVATTAPKRWKKGLLKELRAEIDQVEGLT